MLLLDCFVSFLSVVNSVDLLMSSCYWFGFRSNVPFFFLLVFRLVFGHDIYMSAAVSPFWGRPVRLFLTIFVYDMLVLLLLRFFDYIPFASCFFR